MASVLVIFASVDGQCARVAERIAAVILRAGHAARAIPFGEVSPADLQASDAVIVGASIRYGHHSRGLESFVRDNRVALDARPNAFFSVSLSAGGPGAKPAEAWGYVDEFVTRTGWRPGRIASFGGALLYTRYNPFIRLMMRMIVRAAGGETDTSRDYEYTDWQAVERFAAEFELPLRPARAA